jgi:hypothetical protein
LVNKATITKAGKVSRQEWLGLEKEWTPNDLRKTARTKLAQLKCPSDVAERIVNPAIYGTQKTYNLYEYADEIQSWLTTWSDKLEEMLATGAVTIRQTDEKYNVEELRELVASMPLTKAGKRLGISDNAVKKRCIKHGIVLKEEGSPCSVSPCQSHSFQSIRLVR